MSRTKGAKNKRQAFVVPDLPCGCRFRRVTGDSQARACFVLPDGSRICHHGRRWAIGFTELPMPEVPRE